MSDTSTGKGRELIAAAKRARTHCVHGHEFTTDNTRIKGNGSRACRQCHRDRTRVGDRVER